MKFRPLVSLSSAFVAVLALSACIAKPASADLVVDIQSGVVNPGGQQTLDVMLSSDSGDQELFELNLAFTLDFTSTSATAGTTMTFIDPVSDDYVFDSDYVFFGNSNAAVESPPADVFALNDGLDRIPDTGVTAYDFATDPAGSPGNEINIIIGSEPKLLTRLMVQHNLNGASPLDVGNDTFQLTFRRDNGDEAFTYLDQGFLEEIFFDKNTGTITVAAIPEPGTFAAMALGSMTLVSLRRRRR